MPTEREMPSLQLVIAHSTEDRATQPYMDAILRAFAGGRDEGGYLSGGEDLGVPIRDYLKKPARPAADQLNDALHTLVIALVDDGMLKDKGLLSWITQCWDHVDTSDGRHAMLIVPMHDRARDQVISHHRSLASNQMVDLHNFGEDALRPTFLALMALHRGRECLARAISAPGCQCSGFLRLFISHAKGDGLPLAQSLQALIEKHSWLRSFYDAKDLRAGGNWTRELEQAVRTSTLVVLRTLAYHTRPWCRRELNLADEYAVPIVVVESRTGLLYPVDGLPLSASPSVQISDGNLLRILYVAVRQGLRTLMFLRTVEVLRKEKMLPRDDRSVRILATQPSARAILRACLDLQQVKSRRRFIVHPDPALSDNDLAVAKAIIASHAPKTNLVTPETLFARPGGKP